MRFCNPAAAFEVEPHGQLQEPDFIQSERNSAQECEEGEGASVMIHYHGTPMGGTLTDKARFLSGRHALVPFPRQDDMGIVAEACQSFVFDNGALSAWKRGLSMDVDEVG